MRILLSHLNTTILREAVKECVSGVASRSNVGKKAIGTASHSFGISEVIQGTKKELNADTFIKSGKKTVVKDYILENLEKENEKFHQMGNQLLDTTESIALALEKSGVSFNREYCEKGILKKVDSCIDKMIRSGSIGIQDRIRTTLFSKNIYDLSILDKIINEYKSRGYVLDKVKIPLEEAKARGIVYRPGEVRKGMVEVDDLSIRLDNTKVVNTTDYHIPFIEGENGNGYADIQMRFVNRNLKQGYQKVPHELIILYGKEYAKAKSEESKYIYNKLRELKTLNILQSNDTSDALCQEAKKHKDKLNKIFGDEISSKLFSNAKNRDFEVPEQIKIDISEKTAETIRFEFKKLHSCITKYYRRLIEICTDEDVVIELKRQMQSDRSILNSIIRDMDESISHFCGRSGMLTQIAS